MCVMSFVFPLVFSIVSYNQCLMRTFYHVRNEVIKILRNFVLQCAAEVIFNGYIRKKEEEAQKAAQRREDVIAGKLIETGKVAAPV